MHPLFLLVWLSIGMHFFGRELVDQWGDLFGGIRMMPRNTLTQPVLGIMAVSWVAIGVLAHRMSRRLSFGGAQRVHAHACEPVGPWTWLLCGFSLLGVIVYSGANINWTFSISERGVGQFERDIFDALSRARYVAFPIASFVLWRLRAGRTLRGLAWAAMVAIAVEAISNGDRRDAMYALIVLGLAWHWSGRPLFGMRRGIGVILAIVGLSGLLFAYYLRVAGVGLDGPQIIYYGLSATLGSLGVGGIAWYVGDIVQTEGSLFGKTFVSYLIGVFVPSFVLHAIGAGEFYMRSSFLFNERFNVSDDMGYDFSMFADFIWNFGLYVGPMLFVVVTWGVFRMFRKGLMLQSELSAILLPNLVYYYVAGMRSDFGFFFKGVVYTLLIVLTLLVLDRVGRRGIAGRETGLRGADAL